MPNRNADLYNDGQIEESLKSLSFEVDVVVIRCHSLLYEHFSKLLTFLNWSSILDDCTRIT